MQTKQTNTRKHSQQEQIQYLITQKVHAAYSELYWGTGMGMRHATTSCQP